ncbi:unnamed protein product [Rangifer tarandus platyrhynchus]|uniref:Uncharacterized protein n=1 Tax=Rangifer tarandus platyrhynchus TaxID=3082113 RepID=A0ABN8XIX7_RANTA|nr:unnamed protein product [Rangifer tarandus platyrhynchus]
MKSRREAPNGGGVLQRYNAAPDGVGKQQYTLGSTAATIEEQTRESVRSTAKGRALFVSIVDTTLRRVDASVNGTYYYQHSVKRNLSVLPAQLLAFQSVAGGAESGLSGALERASSVRTIDTISGLSRHRWTAFVPSFIGVNRNSSVVPAQLLAFQRHRWRGRSSVFRGAEARLLCEYLSYKP